MRTVDPVGRYQIAGEIGRGAMGVVYKALDPALGRTVAIKTIALADFSDVEARQRVSRRLLNEARAAGTLSHPNIVTVYDVIEQGEFVYIVMEYLAGPSLEEMLKLRQLPVRSEQLGYLRQLAEALDYAHRKGIVHRDVKPANILLVENGPSPGQKAKLTDFGVAKSVSEQLAQSGSVTGTPDYMSPEQVEGGEVGGRSDQFALAILAYELLCGSKPFVADTLPGVLEKIRQDKPPPIATINPRLNDAVGKVMERGLAKDPGARFASASDFIGALSVALGEESAADAVLPSFATAESSTGTRSRGTLSILDEADEPSRISKRKLVPITMLCFAVAAASVFLLLLNSGIATPVQTVYASAIAPVNAPDMPRQIPPPPAASAKLDVNTSAPVEQPTKPVGSPPPASAEATPPELRPKPLPSVADIDLMSEPSGAQITVDERSDAKCTAPCTMALAAGRHTLTAELQGFVLARRIFNLPDDSRLYIPMKQSAGVIVVTSVPAGAIVSVDGKLFGQTPATLHLTSGVHQLQLARGNSRRQETVTIEPDSFQSRSVQW